MYTPVSRPFSYPDSVIQALHKQFANPPWQEVEAPGFKRLLVDCPAYPGALLIINDCCPKCILSIPRRHARAVEACTCVSGSSTTVVQPVTLSSISIITQSCDYATWPYFQLTDVDPTSNGPARELSFSLRLRTDTEASIVCKLLADVVEFIETTIAVQTDTEETLPEELKVDQKLLAACESAGVGSKF